MYCPKCGKELSDEAVLCPNCRTDVSMFTAKETSLSSFVKIKTYLKLVFFLLLAISSFTLCALFVLISVLDSTAWLIVSVFLLILFIFSVKKLSKNYRQAISFKKHKTVDISNYKIPQENKTEYFEEEPKMEENKEDNTYTHINHARNDNYATAAMLRWSEYGKPVGDVKADYPYYLESSYKIHNPVKYHQNLIRMGYLEPADASLSLSTLKVADLKKILTENNIKPVGKKADLLKLVVDNVDCDSLNLEKFYIPSSIGKAHINKYEYIFRLHKYNISIEEFETFQTNYSQNTAANTIIVDLISSRYSKYYDNNAFSHASNEMFHLANFFEDCADNEKSLFFLIVHFYLSFYDAVREPELFLSFLNLSVEKIFDKREYYSPSMVYKCCENFKLPIEPILPSEYIRLLNDIFADKPINFYDYFNIAETNTHL